MLFLSAPVDTLPVPFSRSLVPADHRTFAPTPPFCPGQDFTFGGGTLLRNIFFFHRWANLKCADLQKKTTSEM